MSANPKGAARLGLVLDGTLLTAAWRGASATSWRTMVVPCDGTPTSVASALAEVAARAPECDEVAITLQRPLATSRALAIQGLSRSELALVLERDWSRHTIGLRAEPHVVAVLELARASQRAAFAPESTLEALAAGARAHGWTMASVRTTEDALAAAAFEAMPAIGRIDDAIIVLAGTTGATEVAHLRRGIVSGGRQLVLGSAAEVVAFARTAVGDATGAAMVLVLGDAGHGDTLARELGREGLRAQHSKLAALPDDSPAALLAASALLRPARMPLVAPSERAARLRRAGIAARWLAAAAVLLAVAGFAIESHRVDSALAEVARERAAIAPRVNQALARRTALESATDAARELAEREARATHASSAVAAIALVLPENAALSMLQIAGDSVRIEGESDRSADVYDALRKAPTLDGVRLAGPLRQERQADAAPVEHFSFTATLKAATPEAGTR